MKGSGDFETDWKNRLEAVAAPVPPHDCAASMAPADSAGGIERTGPCGWRSGPARAPGFADDRPGGGGAGAPASTVHPLRRLIRQELSAMLGGSIDPITMSPTSLFGPESVAARIHRDVLTMLVGGLSALLLQMLHPRVLAGVWDHSVFRADLRGRLLRTAQFLRTTTFGDAEDAHSAIEQLKRIHQRVCGTLPDGTAYSANDPELLDWVHVTGAMSFLQAWTLYAEPSMPLADRDRYFAEMAIVASALGAARPPQSFDGAERLVHDMRPLLAAGRRSQDVAQWLFCQRSVRFLNRPAHMVIVEAAIDLLPDWARQMHGFRRPAFARPLIHIGTRGLAQATRWALYR